MPTSCLTHSSKMAIRNCPNCVGLHGSLGHQTAGLRVERPISALLAAPALVRQGDRLRGGAFDDRNQLDVLRVQFIAEEAIDLERMVRIGGVDRAEDIDVDLVLAQAVPAAHHVVEAALVPLVDAVGIVQMPRTVDADADEVVVLLEECRPFVVDQRAVGLNGVQHALMRLAVLVRQLDGAAKEVQAAQHRLAALPRDVHLGTGGGLHQLPDVGLQQRLRHQRAFARRIQVLLRQEEAVLATEVAGRAGRLGQEMIRVRRCFLTSHFGRAHRDATALICVQRLHSLAGIQKSGLLQLIFPPPC